MMLRFYIAVMAALCCAPAYAEPLKVVASFSILADMAHQIAGDHAKVISLVGPDGDAHAYEPTPKDVRAVTNADILLVNGLGLEGWLDRLTGSAGFKGKMVIASRAVTPIMHELTPDPHAWQSIPNGKLYIRAIAEALENADPEHAEDYQNRAAAYLQELNAMDAWVRERIDLIPAGKRIAITSHDALGYFARQYGVTFIAPLGLSTSGDVSAGGIARLIDQLREGRVRAVFLENMTDPRLMRQLVADGGAVVGGTLYSDALSPADGPAPTYMAMFRHNVTMMTDAMEKN